MRFSGLVISAIKYLCNFEYFYLTQAKKEVKNTKSLYMLFKHSNLFSFFLFNKMSSNFMVCQLLETSLERPSLWWTNTTVQSLVHSGTGINSSAIIHYYCVNLAKTEWDPEEACLVLNLLSIN